MAEILADKNIQTQLLSPVSARKKRPEKKRSLSIKNIDIYLVKSFVAPFIGTFFLTLFVLIMQFLYKYVDDLAGKGLPWPVVGEFILYATAATMVPLALPLATLLSSMMTIGNLAEHYELTSLKSTGISLWRIIRSLLIVSILISFGALMYANYAVPAAYLKFGSLYYDIRQQRPALNIRPGIFYNEIEGFSIRVGRKEADNQTIHEVMIYDHTRDQGEMVVIADSGKMYMTKDEQFLVLELYNGEQYEELSPVARPGKKYEQVRVGFKEWFKTFDLSQFSLTRTDERLFKESYQMQNVRQLTYSIDTMEMEMKETTERLKNFSVPYYTFSRADIDSLNRQTASGSAPLTFLSDSSIIVNKALTNARNMKGYAEFTAKSQEGKADVLRRYKNERQRKFSLSFACFLLFLIGASLGAIIRKGGFGLPFVVSVLFFILFYILSIAGEKMAKEGVLSPFAGMWFSTMILLPWAFYLLYKANHDSAMLNADAYISFFRRILKKIPAFRE